MSESDLPDLDSPPIVWPEAEALAARGHRRENRWRMYPPSKPDQQAASHQETTMHKEFTTHMLNEGGKAKAKAIAEAFDLLLTTLETIVPGTSREMSIARTKLEEASFFAKKAMASLDVNNEP